VREVLCAWPVLHWLSYAFGRATGVVQVKPPQTWFVFHHHVQMNREF
jgi:hypothetical protein